MRVDNKIKTFSQISQEIYAVLANFGLWLFRAVSEKMIKKNPLY